MAYAASTHILKVKRSNVHPGTNALRLGDYNQQVVLELIRNEPSVSRVEIAERTGLTAQAISKIVRKLVGEGLVLEGGTTTPSARGGRPATELRVNPEAAYAIGVQIDRDVTTYAVLDLTGAVVAKRHRTTPVIGSHKTITQIGSVINSLLEANNILPDKVLGVGVGVPGPMDPETGIVYSPGGMIGWGTVELERLIHERTGFPVTVDNDAVAAAVGESWVRQSQGVRHLLFVYASWGLGAAFLIDGQVYRGAATGSEFHHVPVDPQGPACECGNRGCVGEYVTPAAVVDEVRRLSGLKRRGATELTYQEVCQAARDGEEIDREVLGKAARMLTLGLLGVTNVVPPDLVVLGGSAIEYATEIYAREVSKAFAQRADYQRGQVIPVQFSRVGPDVGAIGAASLVLHTTYSPRVTPVRS
jgi:predicted NBD/HSP70 family sugar kinase